MRLRRPKAQTAIPWETARDRAAAQPVLAAVRLPLAVAGGAVLAAPLRARSDLPACDTAAMDGYAVAGPGPWTVVGRVLPGRGGPRMLTAGEAAEIGTGAPVPHGAGAVLPYEQAARAGGEVTGLAEPGRHIRRRGEECAAGTEVLAAGAVLTPAALGLAAALGHDAVTVRPRPRVAVLVTGDEIAVSGPSGPGRTRDAISPLLPGLVEWAGGATTPPHHVPDDPTAVATALHTAAGTAAPDPTAAPDSTAGTAALHATARPVGTVTGGTAAGSAGAAAPGAVSAGVAGPAAGGAAAIPYPRGGARQPAADIVVVCGASSRGPADHLRGVLCAAGAEFLVEGVACRPGHPQLMARLPDGPLVVGLPGNAFAAFAAAMTLLVPALAALTGRAPRTQRARLDGEVRPRPGDTRLVPVRRTAGGVAPVGHDGPALLWGAALADALAVVPPGAAVTEVEILPLPGNS